MSTGVASAAASQPAPPAAGRTVEVAGPWKLVWWKFRKHKLAMASLVVVVLIYLVALLAEFLAPFDPADTSRRHIYSPPQPLHLFDESWRFAPHVLGLKSEIEPEALRRVYVVDPEKQVPIRFLAPSEPYLLAGFLPMSVKLFGPANPRDRIYLLGGDRLGRDLFSRLIHGTRVSMSIGLVGVAISLVLGIFLGGISGYYGGAIDTLIQRLIELLRSIPTIPLWMGFAAAIPLTWSPLTVYFIITLILSLIGWTSLAREVRGKFMALKHEDFVTAARLDGLSELSIIRGHMVPSFMSHIIASVTLAIPLMILSETALSFLGIGLRPPVVSWGTLLQDAQNVRAVATAPWLLIWPGAAVVMAVLALNFLGDGLRDAADPYGR